MQSLSAAHLYTSRERVLLFGALAVVAIVHLSSFLYFSNLSAQNPKVPPYPIVTADSSYYTRLADSLLVYHRYSDSNAPSPSRAAPPARGAPPGYPFFLAAVKGATGSFTPASLIQTALALLAVALIYAIGRRYVPVPLALLAALVYGVEPMVVYVDTTLLTDGLFSSLLVLIIYLGFFQYRLWGVARAALLVFLLCILAMIRPTGELFIVIVPALFAIREWIRTPKEREGRHAVFMLAVYALCVALIILPWIMRNHAIWGYYGSET